MTEQYTVGELDNSLSNKTIEGWANAMDFAEEYCNQFDEQIFMGVWLEDNLMGVFDGTDWFTK